VIGVPDAEMGEQVKAIVQLRDGVTPSDELAGEIIAYVRDRIAHYKAPRSVDFVNELPRLATGKLAKRLLSTTTWRHPHDHRRSQSDASAVRPD
jgi:long-chain acyl-CoA synthetase